jgi:hypothetical protein
MAHTATNSHKRVCALASVCARARACMCAFGCVRAACVRHLGWRDFGFVNCCFHASFAAVLLYYYWSRSAVGSIQPVPHRPGGAGRGRQRRLPAALHPQWHPPAHGRVAVHQPHAEFERLHPHAPGLAPGCRRGLCLCFGDAAVVVVSLSSSSSSSRRHRHHHQQQQSQP